MEHRSKEQIGRVASVCADRPADAPDLRRKRLERWAYLLDQRGDRLLNALARTEHQTTAVRNTMRRDGSAIAIAFADPVLRADGLGDDTYGAAQRFFGLSDVQLHNIVCDCHAGSTVWARAAAWRVRAATPPRPRSGFIARAVRLFTGEAGAQRP